jgi:hypothetical protein
MARRVFLILISIPIFSSSLFADLIDGWSVNQANANSPLVFTYNGITLEILKDMGPVFVVGNSQYGPGSYTPRVISTQTQDGYTILTCRAEATGLSAIYSLKFKKRADGSMEMIIDGGKNVSGFQCGRILGTSAPFKQFYIGQRETEAYPTNDGQTPLIYWPEGQLFFYAFLNLDVSNSAGPSHRFPAKANFLLTNPPVGSDTSYAILTDGTRPALHEEYLFRISPDLWDAFGPVPNQPSEYASELSGMVFVDIWNDRFDVNRYFLDWLKKTVDGKVRFYTVVEQWGYGGFDATLPDLYRPSDHGEPWSNYGTKDQLKGLVALSNSIGRTALRTNYMLVQKDASYSYQEGLFTMALNADSTHKWHSNFTSILPLVNRQDSDMHRDFGTMACFSDQLTSGGCSAAYVNYDSRETGAGTIAAARSGLRNLCQTMKNIHQGPLASESYMADFLIGQYVDTGDFQIFAADQRFDFTPEEKLRRYHQLTTTHSMGLGYRFFFGPWETDWMNRGCQYYYEVPEKQDSYRACEILYGNGGYLFFYSGMHQVQALTECFTVGLAQKHYALQQVDYVKYGQGTVWKTFDTLVSEPQIDTREKLQTWFKRFHIRYANGCHVYVNRDIETLMVTDSNNITYSLPQNGWLVYTEDGRFLAYTAQVTDSFFPARQGRVDFCEDKNENIKYVNPRNLHYMGVNKPTVWFNDEVHFVLNDPQTTFQTAFESSNVILTDNFNTNAATNDQNVSLDFRQTGSFAPLLWEDLNYNTTADVPEWDGRVCINSNGQLVIYTGTGESGLWNPGLKGLPQSSAYRISWDQGSAGADWTFARFNSLATGWNLDCGVLTSGNWVQIFVGGNIISNGQYFNLTGAGLHHIDITVVNGLMIPTIDGMTLNAINISQVGTRDTGIGYFSVFGHCSSNYTQSYIDNFKYMSVETETQAPVFTPGCKYISGPTPITISSPTQDAIVYYTTNGSTPTVTSTRYTTPIVMNNGGTLKAIVVGRDISNITTLTFQTPTSYNRPATISPGSAVVDGNLSEWANETWIPLDQDYNSIAGDVSEAYYIARWQSNKIYVAVKVRDTRPKFADTYGTDWWTRDSIEVFLHTDNNGDITYSNAATAQQYILGVKNSDPMKVWMALAGNGLAYAVTDDPYYLEMMSPFIKTAGKVAGDGWIYYELAITPFTYCGLLEHGTFSTSVVSHLDAGDVIGLDVCVVSNDGTSTQYISGKPGYTGTKSENLLINKNRNWTKFGLHKLAPNLPGDANGDNMVDVGDLGILAANYGQTGKTWTQGDFNGDGSVDVGDLGILAANYGMGVNATLDFSVDYAKAFGSTVSDEMMEDADSTWVCGSLGLPLLAGLALMGLMLVKWKE